MTKIKICGMRRAEDIDAVNVLRPDLVGFIFVPGRRRYVQPEEAEALRRRLSPGIRSVGVFADQTPEEILEVLRICKTDYVQLHGQETDEVIRNVQKKIQRMAEGLDAEREDAAEPNAECKDAAEPVAEDCGAAKPKKVSVIRAYSIADEEDVRKAQESPADLILLDHGAGGTGEAFDWGLLREITRPYLLAGGLGPENIRRALEATHAAGVDASSLLETDGWKDPVKMEAFVRNVRAFDQSGMEDKETV